MQKIVMLLSNPFRPDPRVLKEAESLSGLGYQIFILCWDRLSEYPPQENVNPNVSIIRVQNAHSNYGIGARQALNLPRFWLSAIRQLSLLKPDIVHCHDFDTLPAGFIWARIHRKPVVYDSHEYYAELAKPRLSGFFGRFLYHFIKIAERLFARASNAIVTVDSTLGKSYKTINPNVIIVGHYPPRKFAENDNQVFDKPKLTLLYAGRISSDRGSLIYIEILRSLIQLKVPAQLLLAGVFTPSFEENLFWEAANGLRDQIQYKGWVQYPGITAIYQEADIGLSILLPEKRYVASLPVKLFEYMSSGLPVIASDFPAIASIVNHLKCGVVVDPYTSPNNVAQIIYRWWKEPSLPKTLGENGRQAILDQYNWEGQIKDLASLYSKLLNKP